MTLAQLDLARAKGLARPKPRTIYPKGTKQPLTKELAEHFCDLISTCDTSISDLLTQNPHLPPFKTLETWKSKHLWFAQAWAKARQLQAEFLIQKCIKEARDVTGKTAHAVRIKFDIYRFIASKFHPDSYGDKPPPNQQTTVNVGISIPQERIADLRSKLDQSRTAFLPTQATTAGPLNSKEDSPV